MKQIQVNRKREAPAKEIVKIEFGLDVHANQITVVARSAAEPRIPADQ